jgi:hypothetical protein
VRLIEDAGRLAFLAPANADQPKRGRRGRGRNETSELEIVLSGDIGSVEDRMGSMRKQGAFLFPTSAVRLVILECP